jgi:hypothetical protein
VKSSEKQMAGFMILVVSLQVISLTQTKNSVADLFAHADTMYEQKDFQGAIADFTQAIKLDPDYANAYMNGGLRTWDFFKKVRAVGFHERERIGL